MFAFEICIKKSSSIQILEIFIKPYASGSLCSLNSPPLYVGCHLMRHMPRVLGDNPTQRLNHLNTVQMALIRRRVQSPSDLVQVAPDLD
jgi:hypothetical protein